MEFDLDLSWIKRHWYFFLLGLGILIFGYCIFPSKPKETETEDLIRKTPSKTASPQVTVDMKGAIVKPGVYQLNRGSTVDDAIKKSGGLTDAADTSYLNLSRHVEDEMVIIVYTKEEIAKMHDGEENVVVVEGKCVCPNIRNDGCLKEEETVTNKKEEAKQSATSIINLNTATKEELETLTGIGPSKADLIIAYREEHGGFQSIEELKEIKGIGDATFDKIKDRLTVS